MALLLLAGLEGMAQAHTWRWSYGRATSDPEHFHAVAVDDAEGSIYTVGDVENTSITIGSTTLLNQEQGILTKFDPWGNVLWYSPIIGSDQETAENLAIAPDGTVYVTGAFSGSCYFFSAGSSTLGQQLISLSSSKDIYLAAFSPSGTFLWARQVGNGNDDLFPDIAADATGISLTGAYRGSLTAGSQTSSTSLSTTTYNIFVIRFDLSGTQQWMVTGGTGSDDQPANIKSDDSRTYLGAVAGNTNLRWFGPGNTLLNSSTQTRSDHVIAAFNTNGSWAWGMSINDPSNSVVGYPNLALACSGLYMAGAVGGGSSFPAGITTANSHPHAYLMRLNPADGTVDWVKTGTVSSGGDRFNPRDITAGKNGLLHIGGTYDGTATYGSSSITSANGTDLFVLTTDTDGTLKRLTAINSSGEQYLSGIAADAYGGMIIAGSFNTALNIPGYILSGPNNANGFVAFAQFGDRTADPMSPALFNAPSAVCTGAAIDLSTWLMPRTAGHATAVTSSSNTTSASNALGAWDNNRAALQGGTGRIVLDLGTIVPAGEALHIRWRRSSGATGTSELRYETSLDQANWNANVTTTSRTNYLITKVILTTPARYIRLIAQNTQAPLDIDGVAYSFGNEAGGTWSGAGIAGSTLIPNASATTTSVTYQVDPLACGGTYSASLNVVSPPTSGSIHVSGGPLCPYANNGTLTLGGTSAPVVGWEWSSDGFAANINSIASTSTALSFNDLGASRSYRTVHDGGVCGLVYSTSPLVDVSDTEAPVIVCPGNKILSTSSSSCSAQVTYSTPVVTDNCNGSAPSSMAQYTYMGTFRGHTYFRSWAARPWGDAQLAATSVPNGHLLTINTADEEQWLNSVILAQTGSLFPYWMGLNDAGQEGTFVWANGDPVTYLNWAAAQPDNDNNGDHVYLNYAGGTGWDDAPSNINMNWIVEIDALPVIEPVRVNGPASGSTLAPGVSSVTYSATDHAGNSSTCSFNIAVLDSVPPVVTCPADIAVSPTTGTCSAPVVFAATAVDNCTASPTVSWSHASGSDFPTGSTTVTYAATDITGNAANCSFTVTVMDDQAPSLICPLFDEYPLLLGGAGCTLAFPDLRDSIGVSDCSAWTNTMSPAPGTLFTQDTLVQMTMWIEDEHGNGAWNNHTIRITGLSSNATVASACDSYTWAVNGTTYNTSGNYTHTVGCHTETLALTITPSSSNSTVASACDSYTWAVNGTTYSASGNYSHTVGCHTETLDLTITPSSSNSTVVSACDSYTWAVNGTTYSTSGNYSHTVGCHTETLDLTITPSSS
ncbi:MAG: HYR domain-containing protein, partial [Flavobacteriales bacterium]|nr:HYR domain-containing protein [Flavobacteriales bacterium]